MFRRRASGLNIGSIRVVGKILSPRSQEAEFRLAKLQSLMLQTVSYADCDIREVRHYVETLGVSPDDLLRRVHDVQRCEQYRMKNLPYRYSQFDMALAWEIKRAGSETIVDGVGKNTRYAFMEGIEIWITVVDAAGKAGARKACFVIPRQVKQDETFPFSVKIPVSLEQGMTLKFTYKYNGSDGGDGGMNWMQTFEWAVP